LGDNPVPVVAEGLAVVRAEIILRPRTLLSLLVELVGRSEVPVLMVSEQMQQEVLVEGLAEVVGAVLHPQNRAQPVVEAVVGADIFCREWAGLALVP
jgi:hypothetical protein